MPKAMKLVNLESKLESISAVKKESACSAGDAQEMQFDSWVGKIS